GFIFISNPFLPGSQHHWVKQYLKVYPQKPNICNLDMHMSPTDTGNLWEKSRDQMRLKAEAGILIYYHFDSSLGIHLDESELDHSWLLLSFSFGQSAVILLGGLRREDSATPMFMHSGDIMVMSGSRWLLYHAVPRIVSSPDKQALPQFLLQELADDTPEDSVVQNVSEEDWAVCAKYIQTSQINMTVRQVLGLGKAFPTEPDNENTVDVQPGTYHEGSSDSEESNVK
ncbi:ALKB1 dioxygenase, partial [Polyodon spathula]|nr:ALKB1 dioxygenase [Polyodon spathula]